MAEALRLCARYVEEVVIGWNLCPWAAKAWRDGEVRCRVFLEEAPEVEAVSAFAGEIGGAPEIAIGLAIFPRARAAVGGWERFAERVRRAGGPFLVAAFHPEYRHPGESPSSAAELVSFLRRTPDPTLQLVRATTVETLAAGRDVSQQIGAANLEAVRARGASALDALVADIRRDREQSYERLFAR